jgi:hypothetical protein
MPDTRSQTQRILDEQLKTRVQKSVDSLMASLTEEHSWEDARRPVLEGELTLYELDQLNHAGIRDIKKEVGNVTGELETLNGLISKNGHDAVIKKGPLKGIPVKYVFYAACFAMILATIVIVSAIQHGKLGELAEAVNIVRNRAVPAEGSGTGRPNE